MTLRPTTTAAAAAISVALLMLSGCAGSAPAGSTPTAAAAEFHGVQPEPVPPRPSFRLRTTDGQPYDFRERTAGAPTLLYFGYTNCPDECPTAMADISAALRSTAPELRDRVQVVFVTTDPERDTPRVLRAWLDKFSTEYIGLVGTQAEVDAAQAATGIAAARRSGPVPTLPGRPDAHPEKEGTAPHTHEGPLGYGVGHANVIFAFDVSDRLPVLYPGGVRPADIAADLPLLAQTQGDAP